MFAELDSTITNTEIIKACRELSLNRSGGPDLILNKKKCY